MLSATADSTLATTLRQRRQRLADRIDFPAIFWSGQAVARNFPALTYPFRASSHFLYFAGLPLMNAAVHIQGDRLTLFMDNSSPAAALWHGPSPSRDDIAATIGADAAYPLAELHRCAEGVATLAVQDASTAAEQLQMRGVIQPSQDKALAEAVIALRLTHDDAAIAEIRKAAAVSVEAHRAGMAATATATTEAQVRAAMEQVILGQAMTCAYNSIVTVHGEVLHNEQYHHPLQPGDLLLADVGAEAPSGWASDITRTWPVSGQFSPTQRAVYDVVLAAHDACIAKAAPGVEYRIFTYWPVKYWRRAWWIWASFRGARGLVEQDAHALFFPHGVGHLLGLDVHDMEDLGDLAGYAPGRRRSDRFGLSYLRLDRPLQAGMAVTIEPGFYQVPGILQDSAWRDRYRDCVNWDRLADFADVRGIRIEDDVLITNQGTEVLTIALPTAADAVANLVSGG
jgi:Xaa-Pro aminopeptidase